MIIARTLVSLWDKGADVTSGVQVVNWGKLNAGLVEMLIRDKEGIGPWLAARMVGTVISVINKVKGQAGHGCAWPVCPVDRGVKGKCLAMTLTPPRIGDLAAQSPTQWLLDKKSVVRVKCRSLKRRRRDGQKITGRIRRRRVQVALPADGASQDCLMESRQTRRRKVAPALRGVHAGVLPFPHTRAVICNAASCAGVRSRNLAAHESPPSHRVLARAARTVRRPGSSNITASCVSVRRLR